MIMEREIKFRAKSFNGIWKYGDLHQWNNGDTFIGIHNENWVNDCVNSCDYITIKKVNPNTIGQFTGLQDKNGKEIYEGDIVHWHNQNYAIVFKYGQFYASIEKCHENVYGGFPLHSLADTLITIDENNICEIIGNIYDNPELLKGGKK